MSLDTAALAPEPPEAFDDALSFEADAGLERYVRLAANSAGTSCAAIFMPAAGGLVRPAVVYGEEVLLNDVTSEVVKEAITAGRHRFTTDFDERHAEHFFVAAEPIFNLKNEVIGALCVADFGEKSGSRQLKHILNDIAAIASTHLDEAVIDGVSPADALFSIVVSTLDSINTGTLDLKSVMKLVIDQAVRLTNGFGAAVGLVDGDSVTYRAASDAVNEIRGVRLEAGSSHAAACIETGRMMLCRDTQKDREVHADAYHRFGARSLATVPLNYRSVTMGVLTVFGDRVNAFTHGDIRILEQLAMLIAVAVERSHSQQALRESEGRYQALINQTAEAIYFACPKSGRILEANPAFFGLLGYGPADLDHLTIIDFVDHSANDISGRLQQVLSERLVSLERRWRTKDGRRIDVQATISVISHDGRDMIFVVARDITSQKAAEASRRRSERKYRDLFERANVPIVIFRPQNEEIIDANQQALLEYGFTREELLGRSLKDLTADVTRGEQEMAHILTQGGTQNFETLHYKKDGTAINLLVSCSLIEYEGETAVLMFGRDITDRKRTERLLSESESRLRAVTENALDLIGIIDHRGRIKYMAGPVEDLIGLDPTSGRSTFGLERVHPEDATVVRRGLIEALQHPERVVGLEFRFKHGNGTWRHLSLKGRNLIELPGVEGILVSIRDVTERKMFEAELVEAKEKAEEMARLKSAFLANMSHEIRTPLTAILGFADVLAREVTGEHREFAELIQEGGQRLSETLNSVLDLARLEAGGFKPVFETIDTVAAVKSITDVFASLATKKDIQLRAMVPAGEIHVHADRGALSRVLQNLVGNAIKFTDRGSVTVSVRRSETFVHIDVEDTGTGIDADFVPHLFDEFKQESTGLARSHEGTGLGLTITRRLVDLMDGTIEVESSKGVGSRFTVSLPLAEEQPGTLHPIIHEEDETESRLKVLVVEDNVYTRLLVERLLRDCYEVTSASNAEEAYAVASETDFDVMLMDINLGEGQDGVEVMQAFREKDGFRDKPFVALTAYAMPEDRNRFLNAGFDHYLSKPFTKEDLRRTIAEAIAD